MMTPLPVPRGAAAPLGEARRAWLTAVLALGAGLAILGIVYSAEIAAAIGVWIASTAFNHCFLVLPMAAYLLYARRDAVLQSTPHPAPLIAAAALPLVLCWFLAERAGIMEARQLLAIGIVQVLVMATLGAPTWRVLAAPALYLFLLVPTGEFLVPWLQHFTVSFIGAGLTLLEVPHFIDGVTIEIPEGRFLVAEACAGLRFLIASVAFGAFYACLMYRSPQRRLLFIALSLVVPVVANGLRALGIVYLGHLLGSAPAAAVDHVLYGWLFFAIVTALLILAGLPFRQSPAPVLPALSAARPARATQASATVVAVVAVALLASLPRLAADSLAQGAAQIAGAAPISLPLPAGCAVVKPAAGDLLQPVTSPELTRAYRCGDARLVLRLLVFPRHVGAGPVFAALRGAAIVPGWDEIASGTTPPWRLSDLAGQEAGQERFATVAAALWIDGRPSAAGVASRLRQAVASLRRGAVSPVVAILATDATGTRQRAHAQIERFLGAVNGLSGIIPAALAREPAPGPLPR